MKKIQIANVSSDKEVDNRPKKAQLPQSAVVRMNAPTFQLAKVLNMAKMQTKLTNVVERNAKVFQSDEELNEAGLTDSIKKRKFLMKS